MSLLGKLALGSLRQYAKHRGLILSAAAPIAAGLIIRHGLKEKKGFFSNLTPKQIARGYKKAKKK